VRASDERLTVEISDRGGNRPVPRHEQPDLEAKLAGEQAPRGWGLFLIENMVDELTTTTDQERHTVELVLHLQGGGDGSDAV
jgi:anti-sigma regulatory factor (Ser/Thr protein kinase)